MKKPMKMVKKSPAKKKKLTDLSGDDKVTKKDVLIGRGVIPATKMKKMKASAMTMKKAAMKLKKESAMKLKKSGMMMKKAAMMMKKAAGMKMKKK
tara:strand:- start:239 stop:523 length:285 start_codon:yes stop_codon:yes gene_type:complete